MLAAGALALAIVLWQFGPQIWSLARDEAALEQLLTQLGWWGPVALVAINVAQIVLAPIPGYVVQAAAGYLYGPLWGGIWGALGLMLGGLLAMVLARSYGRPLAERLLGSGRLDKWEAVTHSTSTVVWFIILAMPTGDLPYFMAGLSHVSFVKILLLTLLIRVPTVFLVAAAGAGVWVLPGWQLGLLLVILLALVILFARRRDAIQLALDRRLQRRLSGQEPS
jgi:uncharacterized membrane protein YdjX (TVP38/TMEM64 family)